MKKIKLLPLLLPISIASFTPLAFVSCSNVKFKIESNSTKIAITGVATFTYTFSPEQTDPLTITWVSSRTSVATIDQNGVLTGVGVGKTTVYAKCEEKKITSNKIEVEVISNVPESIVVDGPYNFMLVQETMQLNAILDPTLVPMDIRWSSSNQDVATVDANGLVTATNVSGHTDITAISNIDDEVKSEPFGIDVLVCPTLSADKTQVYLKNDPVTITIDWKNFPVPEEFIPVINPSDAISNMRREGGNKVIIEEFTMANLDVTFAIKFSYWNRTITTQPVTITVLPLTE